MSFHFLFVRSNFAEMLYIASCANDRGCVVIVFVFVLSAGIDLYLYSFTGIFFLPRLKLQGRDKFLSLFASTLFEDFS